MMPHIKILRSKKTGLFIEDCKLYEIGKSGKVLSKYKEIDIEPMDCSCIRCENEDFYIGL